MIQTLGPTDRAVAVRSQVLRTSDRVGRILCPDKLEEKGASAFSGQNVVRPTLIAPMKLTSAAEIA